MRILLLAALLYLSGCSSLLFTDLGQKTIREAQNLMDWYCDTSSPLERQAFRDAVNANEDGHSVRVTCASDE